MDDYEDSDPSIDYLENRNPVKKNTKLKQTNNSFYQSSNCYVETNSPRLQSPIPKALDTIKKPSYNHDDTLLGLENVDASIQPLALDTGQSLISSYLSEHSNDEIDQELEERDSSNQIHLK